MAITKTFSRKDKNVHERFYIELDNVAYFVFCKNERITLVRERVIYKNNRMKERFLLEAEWPTFLTYEFCEHST